MCFHSSTTVTLLSSFKLCDLARELVLQPVQIHRGRLQKSVTPLLPLKHLCGHLWGERFQGAFPSESFLYTPLEQVDAGDGVTELFVQLVIARVQVLALVLQDFFQAFFHENKAALNQRTVRRRIPLDLELRKAGLPSAKVPSIRFILKREPDLFVF